LPRRIIKAINGKQNATMENLEILLTLSKFGRIMEFDDKTKSVKITKTNSPSIVAKFSDSDGTACELKVWGEGKEIEGSYTYEDGYWEYVSDESGTYYDRTWISQGTRTIRVKVPTIIKMYLKHGTSTWVSFDFQWDSNLRDYINTSMKLQVVNLGFEEETKVNTTEASAVFSFTYGGRNIITAAANLPKYKLIGWDDDNEFNEDKIDIINDNESELRMLLHSFATNEDGIIEEREEVSPGRFRVKYKVGPGFNDGIGKGSKANGRVDGINGLIKIMGIVPDSNGYISTKEYNELKKF
jgi:hypothetical protein